MYKYSHNHSCISICPGSKSTKQSLIPTSSRKGSSTPTSNTQQTSEKLQQKKSPKKRDSKLSKSGQDTDHKPFKIKPPKKGQHLTSHPPNRGQWVSKSQVSIGVDSDTDDQTNNVPPDSSDIEIVDVISQDYNRGKRRKGVGSEETKVVCNGYQSDADISLMADDIVDDVLSEERTVIKPERQRHWSSPPCISRETADTWIARGEDMAERCVCVL